MRTNLFELSLKLPHVPDSTPIYRVNASSVAEKPAADNLLQRLNPLKKLLHISGKLQDLGDRTSIRDGQRSLQIYHTSDSFWYLDGQGTLDGGNTNLDVQQIRHRSTEMLQQLGLLQPEIRYTDAGSTLRAEKNDGQAMPRQVISENKVRFAFFLDHRPVFGPGAKATVAFNAQNKISQLLYFWRKVKPAETRSIISPAAAVDLLQQNFRFQHLHPDSAKVRLHSIELGQYAYPPYALQRFLVPVYAIRGTVSTPQLPRQDFTLHVTAIKLSPDDFRQEGLSGSYCPSPVF